MSWFPAIWLPGLWLRRDMRYSLELTVPGSSRGPGTSFPFALKLVELLCGHDKRKAVSGPMVFPEGVDW